MLHVEAAVEVLTSAFGSPCIEGLLGSQLRMSRLEFRECFGIASGYWTASIFGSGRLLSMAERWGKGRSCSLLRLVRIWGKYFWHFEFRNEFQIDGRVFSLTSIDADCFAGNVVINLLSRKSHSSEIVYRNHRAIGIHQFWVRMQWAILGQMLSDIAVTETLVNLRCNGFWKAISWRPCISQTKHCNIDNTSALEPNTSNHWPVSRYYITWYQYHNRHLWNRI